MFLLSGISCYSQLTLVILQTIMLTGSCDCFSFVHAIILLMSKDMRCLGLVGAMMCWEIEILHLSQFVCLLFDFYMFQIVCSI